MGDKNTSKNSSLLPGHGIGFRLFNPEDQAVLFVDHDMHGHRLTCEVTNVSDRILQVPAGKDMDVPGPDKHYFALRFRRGLLQAVGKLKAIELSEGWKASKATDEADGISIYFLYTGEQPISLQPRESLNLIVEGAQADVKLGARTTHVELLFQGLQYENDLGHFLSGTRLHLLNVVNHLGHRHAPLLFHWEGSHRVLNNVTAQMLRILILNTQRDRDLEFSQSEEKPTRLIFGSDSKQIKITEVLLTRPEQTDGGKLNEKDGVWTLAADAMNISEIGADKSLEVTIKVTTGNESDTALLHVRSENLPGFWDNSIVLPIEVSPFSLSGSNVGIGTTEPIGLLSIKGESTNADGHHFVIQGDGPANLRMGCTNDYSWIQSHGAKPLAINPVGTNNVGIHTTDPKAPLDVNGDVNASGKIKENGHDLLPQGAIIMWSGKNIPAGWVLCDGGASIKKDSALDKQIQKKKIQIPDLRERFIIGAGNNPEIAGAGHELDSTGGQHAYQLETGQLPAHQHNLDFETEEKGKHRHHHYDTYHDFYSSHAGVFVTISIVSQTKAKLRKDMTEVGPHKHRIRGKTKETGKGKSIDNRPMYYAMAFIMKV